MKALLAAIIFVVFALFGASVFAQSDRPESKTDGKKNHRPDLPTPTPTPVPQPVDEMSAHADDGEVIKVSTQVVSVPVRVMDKKGRFIAGLSKENFKVFENGKEQEVALFSNENEPFTVALVLDVSYGMKFKIAEIQSAAIAFIDQLRPQDRAMVVSFDGEVHMLCEATGDRKEIYRAIKTTKIADGTSLYEAIDLVMNKRMLRIEGRKAIILFTDGVDTTSRRVNDLQNLNDAMELDSLIYTIRYDTFADVQAMKNRPIIAKPPPITIPTSQPEGSSLPFPLPTMGMPGNQGTTEAEYKKAEEYLDQLVTRTGGRLYQATTLGNLADAYSKIASELREFYSIGYYPKEDRLPGGKADLNVKVDQPGWVVRSRASYMIRKKKKDLEDK